MLQTRNNEGAEDGDDEEDGPVHPIGSPLRRAGRGRVTRERHQSWGWRCWVSDPGAAGCLWEWWGTRQVAG